MTKLILHKRTAANLLLDKINSTEAFNFRVLVSKNRARREEKNLLTLVLQNISLLVQRYLDKISLFILATVFKGIELSFI